MEPKDIKDPIVKYMGKMVDPKDMKAFGLAAAVAKFADVGDIPNENVANIAKAVDDKFGKLIGRFLGGGSKGFAWMVGTDWVLKLTIDQDEAYAASILLGKHHPNVGAYRNVARVGRTDLYVIIQEYAGQPIKDAWLADLIDKTFPASSEGTIEALKQLVEKSSHPVWEQLLSGMLWIRDNGIKFFDLHADNVVQSGDTYKIIDVGVGDPEPMNLGRVNLEHKMSLAFSDVEVINPPFQVD